MAISHAYPLLLFFVSLFFLPAVLGTVIDFYKTSYTRNDVMNVTKVEIIPYPITFHNKSSIFKITGVASRDLTDTNFFVSFVGSYDYDGSTFLERSFNGSTFLAEVHNICDLTKCPMKPGPFVLTIADVDVGRGDDYNRFGTYRVLLEVGHPGTGTPTPRKELVPSPEDGLPTQFDHGVVDEVANFLFHTSALVNFTNIPRQNGVNVTKVEILPFKVTVKDNPVFRITADTPINISSSAMVMASMAFDRDVFPRYSARSYKLCDSSYHCPIEPGRFVLALAHPYSYTMKAGRYRVHVLITKENGIFAENMELVFWFSVSEKA